MFSNCTVVDGTGSPAYIADVAVETGTICGIGDLSGWRADQTVDAQGLVLAPGFIDVHTHDDHAVFTDRSMDCKVSQGVTTVIAGNCGISLAPFTQGESFPAPFPLLGSEQDYRYSSVAEYRRHFDRMPASVNLALLAGHSSLRVSTMLGCLDRSASHAETEAMKVMLDAAFVQGCIGLSTGLDYPPARSAPTEELVELAKIVAGYPGKVFTSHIRNESDQVIEAVEEVLDIGQKGRVPIVISHHKCAGRKNHGRSVETLAAINRRKKQQNIALDVYPYTASSTSLLPQYIREAEKVLVTYSDPHPGFAGWDLEDVATDLNCSIYEAADQLYPAGGIYFQMNESDIARIMSDPACMIGSDGLPGARKPHPRLWGTFPRVLSKYVRDDGVLTLEAAVHKMTGLSAQTFGLQDRGLLKTGYRADLVLFDAAVVRDTATYEQPDLPASGIELVLVNGSPVWRRGEHTGNHPGQFIEG